MTRREFEFAYARRSRISVERLRAFPRRAYPCECGDDGCEGWQMVNPLLHWEDRLLFATSRREKLLCWVKLTVWRMRDGLALL